jgi:hypothetical protein
MRLTEGPRGLRLEAAVEGGYVVYGASREEFNVMPSFAGTLDQCLSFMSGRIAKHYEPATVGPSDAG